MKMLNKIGMFAILLWSILVYANQRPPALEDAGNYSDLDWTTGWYVGTGVVYQSPSTIQTSVVTQGNRQELNANSDSVDNGWTVYVGKEITNFFNLEFSYIDIGGGTASTPDNIVTINYDSAYAYELNGLLRTPKLLNTHLFGVLGYDYLSQSGTQMSEGSSQDFHYNGVAYFYGLGMQWDYKKMGLRFTWNNTQVRANSEDDVSIQNLYMLSVIYHII